MQTVAAPPQTGATGSFAELSAFMEKQQALFLEQQALLLARDEKAKQEATQVMEAKLERAQADMDKLREEMKAQQREAVTADELSALQARLEALHAAQLLADEELHMVEDLCADFVELQAAVPNGGVLTQNTIYSAVGHSYAAAVKLHKLVRLSASMGSDGAFARQLKRKFL